ncbi:hypothetical protein B0H13DRAFT_2227439 [Mycena leptocephala]|nr:hypothetical protein B0H13DRAFT_2227439 [Mycena leptocephala]
MRQQEQTPEDEKLQRPLLNMSYGACMPDDIAFLESRIAGFRPDNPKLNTKDIRNVSVITVRNSQKDMLKKMGGERFAHDTNQTLVEFCSIDRISARSVDNSKWKSCKKLWDAPSSTTNEFIPGKLSVCIGMPIMLRANDATDLCMTKGQEGVACGWHASEGPAGQQITDLPENVVPLVRTTTHITCLLSNDTLLSVLREQVGLSAKNITSGMDGHPRQELRELEILDEITRLRYEG